VLGTGAERHPLHPAGREDASVAQVVGVAKRALGDIDLAFIVPVHVHRAGTSRSSFNDRRNSDRRNSLRFSYSA